MQFPNLHMSTSLRRWLSIYPFRGSWWTSLLSAGALVFLLSTPCWAGGLYITEWGTPSTGVANAGGRGRRTGCLHGVEKTPRA